MGERLVIYGATGYTGKLVAATAKAHKLNPLLSGRNGGKLLKVASSLGFEAQTASLTQPAALDKLLSGARVVLNVAGPFNETAAPLMEACLRNRVSYVDITGEIEAIEAAARLDGEARRVGISLLPGFGFDVVASDCLATHVANRVEGPSRISVAVSGVGMPSRGTARMIVSRLPEDTPVYRDSKIVLLPDPLTCAIDFGTGPREAVTLGVGDLTAVHMSTGIPNIEVYFEASAGLKKLVDFKQRHRWLYRKPFVQRWIASKVERLPEGPTPSQRDRSSAVLLADAMAQNGTHAVSRLVTPNPHTLTALTAIACTRAVMNGQAAPGFATPAKAFGADYILKFPGVKRTDLA